MVSLASSRARRLSRKGLTLIELVVVFIILVAVAGLLIPRVDFLRKWSQESTTASTIQDLSQNIQLYKTASPTSLYPDRFDSLLSTGTNTAGDGAANALYVPLDARLAAQLTATDINTADPEYIDSLTAGGITILMLHETALAPNGQPGNSGVTQAGAPGGAPGNTPGYQNNNGVDDNGVLGITDDAVEDPTEGPAPVPGTNFMAQVNDNSPIALAVYGDADGDGIVELGDYPDFDNDGEADAILVAVGVGPANLAVGKTMLSVPSNTIVDPLNTYNRYIAIFAVYNQIGAPLTPPRPAELRMVIDPQGKDLSQKISDFNTAQNSLGN